MTIEQKSTQVSKRQFAAYERVRASGRFNMLTHSANARGEAGLSKTAYNYILKNYSMLMEVWPKVRKK